MAFNPQQIADKWARRTKAAVADYQSGVQGVTEAPGVAAAARVEKMRANINRALDDGTWERRVAGVPLAEWKQKTMQKGAQRIGAGVDGAASKSMEFYQWLDTQLDAVKAEVDRIQPLTLEDSINRMVTQVRGMAARRFKAR